MLKTQDLAVQFPPRERHWVHWKVLSLLAACGLLSTGLDKILFMTNPIAGVSLASIVFAILLLAGVSAAMDQGWISILGSKRARRSWVFALLFTLAYPVVALACVMTILVIAPTSSFDFDEHPIGTLTGMEIFRDRAALPAAILISGIIAMFVCAVAVFVLVGKWPRHSARWAGFIACLVSIAVFVWPLGNQEETLVLAVVFAQPILAALVGQWLWTASEQRGFENASTMMGSRN